MKTLKDAVIKKIEIGKESCQRAYFTLGEMASVAVAFAVIAITVGLSGQVLNQVRTTQTAGSAAINATDNGLTAVATLSSYLPTIGTVAAAAVVIGLVLRYLGRGGD